MADWGSVPDWFVAIGTVGAFVTGGVVIGREVARDHDREDQSRRAQANRVAAWGERTKPPGHLDRVKSVADGVPRIKLIVMNGSELPIYNVVVMVEVGFDRELANVDFGMIPAQDRPSQEVDETDDYAFYAAAPVEVSFTDSAGFRWLRDATGHLRDSEPTKTVDIVTLPRSKVWRERRPDGDLAVIPRLLRRQWEQYRARRALAKTNDNHAAPIQ